MRAPPTSFQKMRYRRATAAELQKRFELARLAQKVATAQLQHLASAANAARQAAQLQEVPDA